MENILGYLEEKWKQLTGFSKKEEVKDKLWNEIVDRYTERYRFYHNLNHLADLFSLFERFMPHINQPAITGFSIFYHDIVHDTFRQDNEEKSALTAREHLQQLNINRLLLQNVEHFIVATKTHTIPGNFLLENDLSFFLDFDLSILGGKWEDYFTYSGNIRKEFNQYPDATYKEGRTHALELITNRPFLFLTPEFRQLFEETARENINKELSLLQSN
jgi:predicted metal-dependent HD superfamily phosphohydrolase